MTVPKKHKKTEPTALDRLFNVAVSDRQFKKMLFAQAELLSKKMFDKDLSERGARRELAKELTQWVYVSGFSGRQRKRMVEKAVKRALNDYGAKLRAHYVDRLRRLKAEAKAGGFEGYLAQCHADRLAERIKSGNIGKDSPEQWW